MLISITAEKFAAAVAALKVAPQAQVKSFSWNGSVGQLDTDQVDLNFRYDGHGTLDVQVEGKHGLARFAPESTIQEHIEAMLNGSGAG
jgi:hypothetical protein